MQTNTDQFAISFMEATEHLPIQHTPYRKSLALYFKFWIRNQLEKKIHIPKQSLNRSYLILSLYPIVLTSLRFFCAENCPIRPPKLHTKSDKERSNHLFFHKVKIAYLTFTGVCGCQCGWAGCILGWYCGCKWKHWTRLKKTHKSSFLTLTFYFPGVMRSMLLVYPRNPTASDLLPCHWAHTWSLLVMSLLIRTHSWEKAKKIALLFDRQPGTSSASRRKHIIKKSTLIKGGK